MLADTTQDDLEVFGASAAELGLVWEGQPVPRTAPVVEDP